MGAWYHGYALMVDDDDDDDDGDDDDDDDDDTFCMAHRNNSWLGVSP